MPDSAFVSVKVAVTVTLSPNLYGPVAADPPPSVYPRVTVGAVVSTVKVVVPESTASFPAVSGPVTVTVTVPSSPLTTVWMK